MQRRRLLRLTACCAVSTILLGGCSGNDDVHITETEMKVMFGDIVIGVWVTNPTDELVTPVINVEDGETYTDSGELPIEAESNAGRDFRLPVGWQTDATEVSYSAWLSEIDS